MRLGLLISFFEKCELSFFSDFHTVDPNRFNLIPLDVNLEVIYYFPPYLKYGRQIIHSKRTFLYADLPIDNARCSTVLAGKIFLIAKLS